MHHMGLAVPGGVPTPLGDREDLLVSQFPNLVDGEFWCVKSNGEAILARWPSAVGPPMCVLRYHSTRLSFRKSKRYSPHGSLPQLQVLLSHINPR